MKDPKSIESINDTFAVRHRGKGESPSLTIETSGSQAGKPACSPFLSAFTVRKELLSVNLSALFSRFANELRGKILLFISHFTITFLGS